MGQSNIRIDAEFQALIPSLTDAELHYLEESIEEHGCRDPLVVWAGHGVLLDGHHRFDICTRLGLAFGTVEISLDDRDDATEWIILNQFGRRNLSPYQRSELALRLEPVIAEKAKKRLATSTGGSDARPVEKLPQAERGKTRDAVAQIAGVSGRTIDKAKVIRDEADEHTKDRLRSGDTTIHAEYSRLRGGSSTLNDSPETPHVSRATGENEWYTPHKFVEAAREAMGGIDCDPASSDVANRTVQATVFWKKEDDGLTKTWCGRVWMNPPYAQPLISEFSKALRSKVEVGEVTEACVLVNNATETVWFQHMLDKARMVCFPRGRVKFLDPDGNATGMPLQGQAILYFGTHTSEFGRAFGSFGTVLSVT